MKTTLGSSILTQLRDGPVSRFKLALPDPRLSFRSKISLFVFLATLLTALVVTSISAHSIRNFLYVHVDSKLPALLQRTAKKVDLFYQQRIHEVGMFAGTHALVQSIEKIGVNRNEKSLDEIRQFLYYLIENSSQFQFLFILEKGSGQTIWAGSRIDLARRDQALLSSIEKTSLSNIFLAGKGNLQIISAPIKIYGRRSRYTLHAVLGLESLDEQLQNWELSEDGVMYLVDANSRYIATNRKPNNTGNARGIYTRPIPTSLSTPKLHEYKNSIGQDVVGSSIYVQRFNGALVVEEPYHTIFAPVLDILWRTLVINLTIVFLFSFIAFRIAVSMSKPIDELYRGVRRISAGEKRVTIQESVANDEVGLLTQAFNTMTHRLDLNTKELERLSATDELTQLYNYRYFQDRLSAEVERAGEGGQALALILCDIDKFKKWNDRYGHSKGDEILFKIGSALKRSSRESDLVARYGGDEFVLLAPNTNLAGALILAEKLRKSVAESNIFDGAAAEPENLTISTGVSVYAGNREALFEDADRALYSAKNSGRDCVRAAGIMR